MTIRHFARIYRRVGTARSLLTDGPTQVFRYKHIGCEQYAETGEGRR